jgi:hypothetical protein
LLFRARNHKCAGLGSALRAPLERQCALRRSHCEDCGCSGPDHDGANRSSSTPIPIVAPVGQSGSGRRLTLAPDGARSIEVSPIRTSIALRAAAAPGTAVIRLPSGRSCPRQPRYVPRPLGEVVGFQAQGWLNHLPAAPKVTAASSMAQGQLPTRSRAIVPRLFCISAGHDFATVI